MPLMRNCNFNMLTIRRFLSFKYVIFFLMWDGGFATAAAGDEGKNATAAPTHFSVHIGTVLDYNTSMGAMADLCISMALSDFYAVHSDYQTRLVLHTKYAHDELDGASAVFELMQNEEVHSILGPQMLTEDEFVVQLGGKAHVPVISFSARSQSLSSRQSPYYIRTTPDDSNQAKALAALCRGFEWHEAVILYEDSDYGSQFLSRIYDAFQKDDIQAAYVVPISTSAADHHIRKELNRLKTMQTRVFLVHMNSELGSRLFLLAKHAGMTSEGYAWIITDGIGNFMNSIDSDAVDSMEGVLGLRSYVPASRNLENFKTRWKKNMLLMKPESTLTELNVYGLWAYDTIWALAMAVEKIGPVNLGFLESGNSKNGSEIFNLRISQLGPKLLRELQNTTFEGLSGEFHLIDGQLKPSPLEIFNVYATGDRAIGYWTPDGGITRKLALTGRLKYSTSTKELKSIVWPGDSVKQPKDPQTKQVKVSGYSIDIFLSALQQLPFSVDYEFIPFTNESGLSNGTYDELLQNILGKTFDMVVGDTTILADRTKYVDFTLPYSESGTVMVVKPKKEKDMWVFKKPFSWDLWLTIVSICIFIGIVLRILENRAKKDSDSLRPHEQQLGLLFWFPIAVLAFPERNMVVNKWSRFVLAVWLFMAFILMQSYTANLSAMFTVDQFDFRFSDDYNVGCQSGTFMRDFLINRLHINSSRIKEYSTIDEYHDAMSNGSKNGGIDAIFDEIPYMKLFLGRYDSKYKIVGPTYRTDGFGFALPLGSPLVVPFSRAILAVTEATNLTAIEQKNFGLRYSSDNQNDAINKASPSLTAYNFGGLFIITGLALIFALFCSETPVGRIVAVATSYGHKCFSLLSFRRNGKSRGRSMVHADSNGDSSSEEEVRGPDQFNVNDLSGPGIDHDSGKSHLITPARDGEANETVESESIQEVQLTDQTSTDVSARQTGS
ncbi:glutamate receptor 2.5-like isoform X2 [Coffea eugenioides]|uniref:glutamate receptor 2.5-like isoform X2 n=1 Tax=Coffea eugenioides TaxID=49369 RepID=UPI000F60B370|nr:glutamate receptor 2.5-like isoform X2 [Coffea eugenioides]